MTDDHSVLRRQGQFASSDNCVQWDGRAIVDHSPEELLLNGLTPGGLDLLKGIELGLEARAARIQSAYYDAAASAGVHRDFAVEPRPALEVKTGMKWW